MKITSSALHGVRRCSHGNVARDVTILLSVVIFHQKKKIINKIKTLAKRLTMEIMVNVGRFGAEIYIRRLNKKFVDFVDKIKSTDAISLKFYVCSRLI